MTLAFLIEKLQPTWLDSRKQIQGYQRNTSALIGVTGGISSAGHMGPNANWALAGETLSNFVPILGFSVASGVIACLIFNILRQRLTQKRAAFISASIYILLFSLCAQNNVNYVDNNYLSEMTPIFVDWAVFFVFLGWLPDRIELVPKAQWSWFKAFQYAAYGILLMLCIYFPIRLFLGAYSSYVGIIPELLISAGISTSIGGLAIGQVPDTESHARPNEGIWIACRNAGLFMVFIGIIGTTIAYSHSDNLPEFVMHAVCIGLVAALMGGQRSGWVLIQHLTLRFMLWRNGHMPWNYARFLDFSVERMFLKRSGNGYEFMHRSLMEHLAEKAY